MAAHEFRTTKLCDRAEDQIQDSPVAEIVIASKQRNALASATGLKKEPVR